MVYINKTLSMYLYLHITTLYYVVNNLLNVCTVLIPMKY